MSFSPLSSAVAWLADPATPHQSVVLGILLAVTAFEAYIAKRQGPFLDPVLYPTLPKALLPYVSLPSVHKADEHSKEEGAKEVSEETTQEKYLKSLTYARDKLRFSGLLNVIDIVESVALLSSVPAPWFAAILLPGQPRPQGDTLLAQMWTLAAQLLVRVGVERTEVKQSCAFVLIASTVGTIIGAPKSAARHFWLEKKHGFNKMTVGTFFLDLVKSFVLSLVLELPLLAGILKVINWVGRDNVGAVVGYVMLFIVSFQLVLIPLYPYVIAPLFNKFTPLAPDAPVYPHVKALSERLGFPLGKVWVMDGSRRSAHSNAYYFGLPGLAKNIVIFDTLLTSASPEEVEAILAHELGHWHGSHVLWLLLTSIAQTAFTFSLFGLFLARDNATALLASFGFHSTPPAGVLDKALGTGPSATDLASGQYTLVVLLLASTLFTPLQALLKFLTNLLTRQLEYSADAFAYHLGPSYAQNLKKALVKIHADNLSLMRVDKVYSAWGNNHPELVERLEALDVLLAKDK